MWYMVRSMATNEYTGPFDEERAKKEALLIAEASKKGAEVLPLGPPAFVANWTGATITDVKR